MKSILVLTEKLVLTSDATLSIPVQLYTESYFSNSYVLNLMMAAGTELTPEVTNKLAYDLRDTSLDWRDKSTVYNYILQHKNPIIVKALEDRLPDIKAERLQAISSLANLIDSGQDPPGGKD